MAMKANAPFKKHVLATLRAKAPTIAAEDIRDDVWDLLAGACGNNPNNVDGVVENDLPSPPCPVALRRKLLRALTSGQMDEPTTEDPAAKRPRRRSTPSTCAKEPRKVQLDPERCLDIDRPFVDAPDVIDVALTFPPFGVFREVYDSCEPDRHEVKFARQLLEVVPGLYKEEGDRVDAVRPVLEEMLRDALGILRLEVAVRKPRGGINDDGSFSMIVKVGVLCAVVVEFKNEFATGDAAVQGAAYLQETYDQLDELLLLAAWPCPCLVLACMGQHIGVLGSVWAGGERASAHVSYLSPLVHFQRSHVRHEEQVARLVAAIMTAARQVHKYLTQRLTLPSALTNKQPLPPPFVFVERKYKSWQHLARLVYLVQLPDGRSVVAKIAQGRFGEKVHRAWAGAGVAPQLLHHQPLPGGYILVEMEYLGPPTWRPAVDEPKESWPWLRDAVLKALAVGQAALKGSVIGDPRLDNIFLDEQYNIMLLDFDWAGIAGDPEAKYPVFVSGLHPCYVYPCAPLSHSVDGSLIDEWWRP